MVITRAAIQPKVISLPGRCPLLFIILSLKFSRYAGSPTKSNKEPLEEVILLQCRKS